MSGTEGRIYGGDPNLIHIADGMRTDFGYASAEIVDDWMRMESQEPEYRKESLKLCPGCYMIAGFNQLCFLAAQNGQSLTELGRTMAAAFQKLADGAKPFTEEINVILDPR